MATDLSLRHEPVSDLFPPADSGREAFRLSDEQLAFYQQNGFVAGIQVLDDRQVDELREQLQGLFDPHHEGRELWYEYHTNESTTADTALFHALGAWRIRPGFHDLLWHPAVTVPASQLLEGPVRFWHDQLFCKPAHHGGVVAWHQDFSYWTRTQPMAHLTCWIGLDDSTEENGCLQYVPGSHRWDLLPITGLAGDMEAIRQVLREDQWEALQHPHPVVLRKGQCSFHHPLMIHGSRENRTSQPRRAAVINLVRDGVRSDADTPLLEGVPVIPPGQPLGGQFFPLLTPGLR